ncbi:hypothetical protein TNCV_488581 [Trichonephila clavipes]|nr:hypothetical protein TNCV_488581 [Trichonephila clavipes]
MVFHALMAIPRSSPASGQGRAIADDRVGVQKIVRRGCSWFRVLPSRLLKEKKRLGYNKKKQNRQIAIYLAILSFKKKKNEMFLKKDSDDR